MPSAVVRERDSSQNRLGRAQVNAPLRVPIGNPRPVMKAVPEAIVIDSIQPKSNGRSESWTAIHLTDSGNAERFVEEHGHDLRYVHAWSKWLRWDGTRWAFDEHGVVLRMAKKTAKRIWVAAADISNGDVRDAVANHAKR